MAAFTKAEPSHRLGRGRGLLLPVGDSPERQLLAEFSAGDEAEARHRRRTPVSLGHRRPVAGLDPDASSWAKATAVAIGRIVSSMRRRLGLLVRVGTEKGGLGVPVVGANTWGISGSHFLLLYGSLSVAWGLVLWLLRRYLLRGTDAGGDDLSEYEPATLNGGAGPRSHSGGGEAALLRCARAGTRAAHASGIRPARFGPRSARSRSLRGRIPPAGDPDSEAARAARVWRCGPRPGPRVNR